MTTTAATDVYRVLAGDILTGIRPEGARLPTVREVAGEYRVSRTTAQQALARLVKAGLATQVGARKTVAATRDLTSLEEDAVSLIRAAVLGDVDLETLQGLLAALWAASPGREAVSASCTGQVGEDWYRLDPDRYVPEDVYAGFADAQ